MRNWSGPSWSGLKCAGLQIRVDEVLTADVVLFRVEQQLMSRMISEMYRPPPSDPAHNMSSDQSDAEERSITSDIGKWHRQMDQ